ncbi:MAG: adenylate/guanylate cyclase domain-containing protein [Mycobacteriales bacterium]
MGTVVLLMTDVVGSTRLWSSEAPAMNFAMRRHHELVHGLVAEHGGWRPRDQGEGDAVFAAFPSPTAAIACAAGLQRTLAAEEWPTSLPLTVRVGLHLGEVVERDGNLFGDPVNRCARLRALAAGGQVLMSSALYETVRDALPTGVGVVDLGEHRMKDLSRPERVWQLTGPGLDGPFPPLAGLDAVRHNLPVQTSSFIGREGDLTRLVACVRENRLATLTGFGGMGKTRLALQAAAELTDGSVGDVWFVDLSAITDSTLVPARVAETLGVRFGIGDPAEAVIESLQHAPRLLLLDNVEQVLGCAPFVATLLERAPAVRILCTSREPLRVRGEHQIPLAPLTLPDVGPIDGDALSTFEAVRLFVDRAVSVRPDFVVDNRTAPAVAEICARLDGHPLALELAAARLKVLSVAKLLDRLDAALTVLTGGSRDMPERHQTLRATIAWSFDALSRDEQLLLTRMVAVPASADLDLIEAVCGEDLDVLDLLERLVDKSLVVTSEARGETRFGLLVSIRQYAAEQIDATALHDLGDRHARALHDRLRGRPSSDEEVRRKHAYVDAELVHVRAALAHRLERGPGVEFAQLVDDLDDTFIHRGLLKESIDLTTAALPRARAVDPPDPELLAGLLTNLCFARTAFPIPSEDSAREAIALARSCSTLARRAEVLSMTAWAAARDAVEAKALLAELDDAIAQSSGQDAQRQQERHNVAAFMLRYVDPAEAERCAVAMSSVARMARPVRMAELLLDRGDWRGAYDALDGATDAGLTGLPNPRWAAMIATRRAAALTGRGRLEEARALLEEAAGHERRAGLPPLDSAAGVADVERAAGQPARAATALERALHGLDGAAMRHRFVLPLRWRQAVCRRELGQDSAAELRAARDDLVSSPLYGPRELLGALVERAVQVADDDPHLAAELIASVQAHRGRWVLPFGMDRDLQELLPRLPATTGSPVAPTQIW